MQTTPKVQAERHFIKTWKNLLKTRGPTYLFHHEIFPILAGEYAKVDYAYEEDGFLYVHMLVGEYKIIARRGSTKDGDYSWALLNNVVGEYPLESFYPKPEGHDDLPLALMQAFPVIVKKGEEWIKENGINGLKTHLVNWGSEVRKVYTLKQRKRSQPENGAAGTQSPSQKRRKVMAGPPNAEEEFFERALDIVLGRKATPGENAVLALDSKTGQPVVKSEGE